uniref:2,4-dienoyl-CoA reductase [(3E)-enoyl-CoA-producing] n=1 Tax=Blastobotrys adeninivorans TaxID=409370 RepID=A0A060T9V3_BLAAD
MPNTLTRAWLDKATWKSNLFDGKVVFITGGAGTICRVEAEMLVLLGANAAIVGRNPEKTEKAAKEIAELRDGAKVIGIGNVDVRKVQSVADAVEKTVAELGKIDYVIAGAAGNFLADFNHLSANAFRTVVEIDLVGSYNTAKATFKELRKNKGHILFISATLHYYGLPLQSHASAAKAGVDSLARTLAVELGPLGIRSNVIAPGPIAGTEGMERLGGGGSEDDLVASIPLQRMGTTEDIANATVFLLSDASSYVTGTVTVVDGGSWQTGQGGVSQRGLYPSLLISQGEDDHSKL